MRVGCATREVTVVRPSASESPPPLPNTICVSASRPSGAAEPCASAGRSRLANRFQGRRHRRDIVAAAQCHPRGVALTRGPPGGTQKRHVCGVPRWGGGVWGILFLTFLRKTSSNSRGPCGQREGGGWAAAARVLPPVLQAAALPLWGHRHRCLRPAGTHRASIVFHPVAAAPSCPAVPGAFGGVIRVNVCRSRKCSNVRRITVTHP